MIERFETGSLLAPAGLPLRRSAPRGTGAKFSSLQSLENSRNRERISAVRMTLVGL
jgi:hypothetical protein